MKSEYNFSKGKRGKFYNPKAVFNLPIYLEKDVNNYIRKPNNERYKLRGVHDDCREAPRCTDRDI